MHTYIYIYIIYTPNLGFGKADSVRKREQGRFRGSREGAGREQERARESTEGAKEEHHYEAVAEAQQVGVTR